MIVTAVRKSLSLKVSLTLAVVTLLLIAGVAAVIISRQTQAMQDMTVNKAKLAAAIGAQAYGRMLEDGVDNGYMTIQELFDKNYEEIKGYDWGGKPKYHTKYDFYTDRVAIGLLDRFLDSEDFVFAVGADANGYVPTHNTRYQKPITGDAAKDVNGNRTKRMFNDEVGLKAATNQEPVLVQFYRRDTGAMMWDVASPIYVKGKHWGGFRIGVSIDEVEKKKTALLWSLVIMFGAFALITTGTIFVMIRQSMSPLVRLSALADQISTGEGLENPIKPTTIDEVGAMTKSVDRLRASLKAAMARLGE